MEKTNPQNLLNRAVEAQAPEHPPGFYKSIILDILTVLSGLVSGFLFRNYLLGASSLTVALIGGGAMSAIIALGAVLLPRVFRRIVILVLSVVAFWIPLSVINPDRAALSAGILLLFMLWGEFTTREIADNSLRIRFITAAGPLVGRIITGGLLAGIIMYSPIVANQKMPLSENYFTKLFNMSAEFTERFFPEIDVNADVDALVKSIARYGLLGTADFRYLPQDLQAEALSRASEEMFKRFTKTLGGSLSPTEPVSKVAYQFVGDWLGRVRVSMGNWFTIGWAVALFLILRGVGVLFGWLVLLISFVLYELLLGLRLLGVSAEGTVKETVKFT